MGRALRAAVGDAQVSSMNPVVLPVSEPKARGSYDRSVPVERTLSLIPELRRRYCITRVADTTKLDRTEIPTVSAVVPHSDLLSVFNGKGRTREAAIASAVMEAVERQIMADPPVETHRRSVREVCESLNLDALGLLPRAKDRVTDCAYGTDLLDGSVVSVPMQLVACPWYGERLFPGTHSNGIASGNTLVEATYHALAELVERHVWSLFVIRSELVPRFYRGRDAPDEVVATALAFPTGDAYLDDLAGRIAAAGLSMRVMLLRERDLPLVALATIVEPHSNPPMAHQGMGCALSPAYAIARAITEAVQSRVVDIAGARDDLLRPNDPPRTTGEHARRVSRLPENRWYYGLPAEERELADLDDPSTDDLADDVRRILDSLGRSQPDRVVAVDLSPRGLPVAVVRIVAPGLENYFNMERIGRQGIALFNPFHLIGDIHGQHDPAANQERRDRILTRSSYPG